MKPKILSKRVLLRLFFDFYVLNELWFKTIGAAQYGYNTIKILPHKKEEAIDTTFNEIVQILKANVIEALERSVRNEIKHFHGCGPDGDYYRSAEMFIERYGDRGLHKKSLDVIEKAFSLRGWSSSYGGKRWAQGTYWLQQLINSKTIKDDVFIIDRIFDLQHNSGFILNKTNFVRLSVGIKKTSWDEYYGAKPLNLRFKSTPEKMTEYCSNYIKKLWFANKNYI
jgi:hypothetical protein